MRQLIGFTVQRQPDGSRPRTHADAVKGEESRFRDSLLGLRQEAVQTAGSGADLCAQQAQAVLQVLQQTVDSWVPAHYCIKEATAPDLPAVQLPPATATVSRYTQVQ